MASQLSWQVVDLTGAHMSHLLLEFTFMSLLKHFRWL